MAQTWPSNAEELCLKPELTFLLLPFELTLQSSSQRGDLTKVVLCFGDRRVTSGDEIVYHLTSHCIAESPVTGAIPVSRVTILFNNTSREDY